MVKKYQRYLYKQYKKKFTVIKFSIQIKDKQIKIICMYI